LCEGNELIDKSYRGLTVWQKATELAPAVYDVTKTFPETEQYGLTSQLRRAAVSVASNIAEGHSRTSTGAYVQHLGFARGSIAEIETQMLIARRVGLCDERSYATIQALCGEVGRMLTALIKRLRP
jgi:four helix bundle protein